MYTRETLEALARARRAVEHLLQGQADDLIAAWLHALREIWTGRRSNYAVLHFFRLTHAKEKTQKRT